MKRHRPDPKHYRLLRDFDEFQRMTEVATESADSSASFLEELRASLDENRRNAIRIYGLRTQAMFVHVAAALGHCELIVEEDSGEFFSCDENLRRPDFRIHTRKGDSFLVEVKNHYKKCSVRFKKDYINSLAKYAALLCMPLFIAVYWSRWNLWTLTRHDRLVVHNDKLELSFPDAMKRNEMLVLGDALIKTKPPLAIRIFPDKSAPCAVEGATLAFTIRRVCLTVGDEEIVEPAEQQLAWFFMSYGNWTKETELAVFDDKTFEFLDIQLSPEHPTDLTFENLGFLSQMISRQFLEFTVSSDRLSPNSEPHELGVVIPDDYVGQQLPIWRGILHPNYAISMKPT